MVIYGYMFMVIYGQLWKLMVIYVTFYGYFSPFMVIFGHLWLFIRFVLIYTIVKVVKGYLVLNS